MRDAVLRELAPHLEVVDPDASINKAYEADGGTSNFYPGKTKRITALVARSETFRTFVTHPLMLSACDAILKPNCVHYQVHATAALKIGPEAREQVLHREEDPVSIFQSASAADDPCKHVGDDRFHRGQRRYSDCSR